MALRNLLIPALIFTLPCAALAGITLIKSGKAVCAIYADAETMSEEKKATGSDFLAGEAETARQRLRDSINDLAGILERISGAQVPIHTRAPERADKAYPIFIGKPAEAQFGPPHATSPERQAYRIVVARDGAGFMGESDEATSYAVYEWLDGLGCRWYMPSDMGEVLPSMATVKLDEMDVSRIPATIYRNIWYCDDAYRRRNRLGGIYYAGVHGLEAYLTREQFEQHPDWCAEIDGKRGYNGRICWASDGAAQAVAEAIIARLKERYVPCMTLSPADTTVFCECGKCKALDAGDWDASFNTVSITDRYINFCNKIIRHVHAVYPEMRFGALAYEQYTRAPVRERPDPSMLISIAPILYCRAHSLLNPNCPQRHPLKEIVAGWAGATDTLIFRDYGFNLAEVTAPYPLITRWGEELPFYYANHCRMWRPETMANFEGSLPGLYMGVRLSWYPELDPQDVLNEFFTRFYGPAEQPMRDYWMAFDRAWRDTPEHAGSMFGHSRRFTPDVMSTARHAMDLALAACETAMVYRRVKIADDSLRMFELYMKMLRDLESSRLGTLKRDWDVWTGTWDGLTREYQAQSAFTSYGTRYARRFLGETYEDADRVYREGKLLTRAITPWRCRIDRDNEGEGLKWFAADFDDTEWQTRDPAVDTRAALGLWDENVAVWHRAKVKLPAIAEGKKVFLWLSRTDGSAKLFINGAHVPYLDRKGEAHDVFEDYSRPGSFDITAAVNPNAENQITLVGRRLHLFELGTGGLLGPVYVYAEK